MPKDWNTAYEKNDTPWDKGFASPPLRAFLAKQVVAGEVLVPGCGSGHDVRLLAGQGAVVIGMDIAPGAIRKAAEYRLVSNEHYVVSDFLNLDDIYTARFDWLVEHTCLCALDPEQRPAYAHAVARALKPGGNFLAVFYREVPDYNGDGPPHPISATAIYQLFADDFEVVERLIPEESYPSRPFGSEEVVWMRKREPVD